MDWIQSKTLFSFPPSSRYLIGVSGGRDSVALLKHLVDLGYRKLVVCHLNHRLRSRASDADARFVKKLVSNYNREIVGRALRLPNPRVGKRRTRPAPRSLHLDLELGSTNVRALAKKKKISIETAGREARYAFFAKVARRHRCRTLFLGHHADDLVETFLINLFRGAGLTGLAGMRDVSVRRVDNIDLTIVRPLLAIWRHQIDAYVGKHRLKFREDASNKDLTPLRNRVRQRIIPDLEKLLGRNIRQSIWRAATIAAEEESWIDDQLPRTNDVDLSVKQLRDLPIPFQRRQILKWLRARKVADAGFDVVERVRSLIDQDARIAKVNLPQDRHVRRRAGKIFIE